jgi:hypothetical protein
MFFRYFIIENRKDKHESYNVKALSKAVYK